MLIGEFYAETSAEVMQRMRSNQRGLSIAEVERRFADYGENELPHERAHSDVRLLAEQFASPLVALLIAALGLSLYIGHVSDAAFIGLYVVLNVSVAFYQERKAALSLLSLQKMIKVRARVLRGGQKYEIDSIGLVPGDIIDLTMGDKVPADARILSSKDLRVDEASLTGEWLAVEKSPEPVAMNTVLAERASALYMGTVVESGSARALVVATGPDTEMGHIAGMLSSTAHHRTPLQRSIASLARATGGGVIAILLLIVLLGQLRGADLGETFVASVALAVSAIPAGLLPAVTVILTLGMRRILKERGLVRHLVAGETLGSVTVICTDKTGTLTEAKMEISKIVPCAELVGKYKDDEQSLEEARLFALRAAVLGTEAFIENTDDDMHEWIVRGRATERAIILAAETAGITRANLEAQLPHKKSTTFTSESKYSAMLRYIHKEERELFVVGAPEIVLERTAYIDTFGKAIPIDVETVHKLSHQLDVLAGGGLRIVAVASRRLHKDDDDSMEHVAEQLTLIAFIALKDPVREDAKQAVETMHKAGVRTLIVTGDHRLTARAVAKEVGLESDAQSVITGADIDSLSDQALLEKSKSVSIYARVSPAHKLRIIKALQKRGEVVAMVGDGVNDAPALKAADVGVAIGSGTDLAKEVADIVLLDDNVRVVGSAIREGRIMFQNIRKVFAYLIGNDLSELAIFVFALLCGLPLPLLPTQILWINLVEDIFPVIGLTLEEGETDVMHEPPRDPHESVANAALIRWLVSIFFITTAVAVVSYAFFLGVGNLAWVRTMLFGFFCFDSLVFSFSVRSFGKPLFHRGMWNNRALTSSIVIGTLAALIGIYLPPFQMLLSTVPLSFIDLAMIVALTVVEIGLVELAKRHYYKKN